jgi:hypothetical protein
MVSTPVPLRIATDPGHGGRWTSLRAGGREWLWHRAEPRRAHAAPGDTFADAGGLEECVPTVRGLPDHGDAWSRPWTPTSADGSAAPGAYAADAAGVPARARTDIIAGGDGLAGPGRDVVAGREGLAGAGSYTAAGGDGLGGPRTHAAVGADGSAWPSTYTVTCPDFRLTRTITCRADDGAVVADYRLTAAPGYRFVWAAHALLDVSPQGRIVLPGGAAGRLYPDGGAQWTPFGWPRAGTVAFDRLGPDDGTALGAVVDTAQADVHDGLDRLRFTLEAEGQPVSVAVWRNLRGFPEDAPYRSIGVEPMLGRVFDLAAAGEGDAARVPASGEAVWRLTVTAATTS